MERQKESSFQKERRTQQRAADDIGGRISSASGRSLIFSSCVRLLFCFSFLFFLLGGRGHSIMSRTRGWAMWLLVALMQVAASEPFEPATGACLIL